MLITTNRNRKCYSGASWYVPFLISLGPSFTLVASMCENAVRVKPPGYNNTNREHVQNLVASRALVRFLDKDNADSAALFEFSASRKRPSHCMIIIMITSTVVSREGQWSDLALAFLSDVSLSLSDWACMAEIDLIIMNYWPALPIV